VHAEGLEHREAQCQQRHQREDGGIDQAGGPQRELAFDQILQQIVDDAQAQQDETLERRLVVQLIAPDRGAHGVEQ